jgi:hypothetical protein
VKCLSSVLLLSFHWSEKVFSFHHLLVDENEKDFNLERIMRKKIIVRPSAYKKILYSAQRSSNEDRVRGMQGISYLLNY